MSWFRSYKVGWLSLLALSAGIAISIQATMNARLGVLLNNSLIGASIAFLLSFMFTLSAVLLSTKEYPVISEIKSVPFYLWFSGSILSAFGVAIFYYLIPKMGVSSMMSYALSGQILVAIIAGHFGWFDLPVKSIDTVKFIGVMFLIAGIFLINWESSHAY